MKSKSLIRRIISNPVIQAIVIYVSGAWVIIELVEYFIEHFNLNEQSRIIILIILLCGLPVALILAWYLSREKERASLMPDGKTDVTKTTEDKKSTGKFFSFFKKPSLFLPGLIIILLLIVAGIRYFNRQARIRWANEQALPEIEQRFNEMNYVAAFNLVQKANKYISNNSDLREWASRTTTKLTILTDPSDADVYIREYNDLEGEWVKLGETPIDSIKLPNYSAYLTKIEKPGYENVLAVASTRLDTLSRKLFQKGMIPPGMVYVEGYWDEVKDVFLKGENGFFMDRYEVTNKQFKEFVDAGGYRNPEYWENEFSKDGETISWEEAMAAFIDKTGRPGPSTWEASDYPDGQDDYPVSGISWYEAAAYAEYVGKSLPTADHWDSGAGFYFYDRPFYHFGSKKITISNFLGKGPEPVGSFQGISYFGCYDMAGNVREWCWNKTNSGRLILGGAWDDANYLYYFWSQLPAFDRSPENGFRCVQYIDMEKIPETAFRRVALRSKRDYSQEEPVQDDIFAIYKNQFLYDSTALDAKVEERDESPDDWTLEKITFNAAYGQERVISYLYLPKNSSPPFQTILYFPGLHAVWEKEFGNITYRTWLFDYVLKNGRAVMYPVYKGTFERNDGLTAAMSDANLSHQYKDWLIAWTKDFSRSIDYLETRTDIDATKLGFMGWSWGGETGGNIPAVEERLKVNILIVGGFSGKALPEVYQVNYLPRIKIPVLMLNGKYDPARPYETNLKPFFDLLGTPEEDKRLCLYETGHFVPKSEMIRETLAFLDKYLGPVK